MDLLNSFSISWWNHSGPADLDTCNFNSFFSTSSGVIYMSVRLLCGRPFRVGTIAVSSLVNTLLKYLFSSSAFSWSSLVSSWPWSVIVSPDPVLFFSFDLQ